MKLSREEIDIFSEEPIELFYSGIKSQVTKAKYTKILKNTLCQTLEDFLEGTFEQRAKQLVTEAKKNPEWAIKILIAYAHKLKQRTELKETDKNYLNPNSIPNYFKPIRKLFEMNSVPMAWARIYAAFPSPDNNSEGRGYSRDEIKKMLNSAKGAMDRAIILVASSSGVREGGLALKWKDVTPVYKIDDKFVFDVVESEAKNTRPVCAILTVYRKSNEEYHAFITPEAYDAMMDYKVAWFEEVGRFPKDDDPLFKSAGPMIKSLTGNGIKNRIYRIAKSSGVWIPPSNNKRRSDIPIMNGFRRFFNKTNKESISKDSPLAALIKKEYMMAHTGLVKLDKNYFQAHLNELIEEYLNAVPNLTISDEERLRLDNLKKQQKIDELEQNDIRMKSIEKTVEMLADTVEILKKTRAKITPGNFADKSH